VRFGQPLAYVYSRETKDAANVWYGVLGTFAISGAEKHRTSWALNGLLLIVA
jgi:hypothetical protein